MLGSIQDARAFCQQFFGWYTVEHRHAGIGLLTPADVHYGRAEQITLARGAVLEGAYAAHPSGSSASHPATSAGGDDVDQ